MSSEETQFESLLDYLKQNRGFDFHAYKRAGLERRVQKRLQTVSLGTYGEYLDYLQVHADEFGELFNTIQINVTSFFRDPSAWEFVTQTVVPAILARNSNDVIRIWSSGCASGQEAYTLAMVMAEAIGRKAFRDRVKIYATDVDAAALEEARQAIYDPHQVEDVPEPLLARYFEASPRGYLFDKELRRSIIFGRNDLIQDAPISRLDLLVCRNTLMYFNAEAQSRILTRFHFALKDDGYLFLGKAELLLTHANLFAPLEMKRRIFTKVAAAGRRGERPYLASEGDGNGNGADHSAKLRAAAFDASPVAEVLLDENGSVLHVNERAKALLGAAPRDVGSPLFVLDFASRLPGLRGAIEQAREELRPVTLRGLNFGSVSDELLEVDVHVAPLRDGDSHGGIGLFVTDATRVKRLQDDLSAAREELEALSEELESTNEELETTNEELQSANEELETTNEELQSTNEELETMNEELQSTNEELQSTNEELQTLNEDVRQRSEDLHHTNLFLESILTSLRTGVAVVDAELRVLVWNRRAEDLWGLRADEVRGRHLMNLDIGLPVDRLKPLLRACLSGDIDPQETTVEATNRRGKAIQCEVVLSPLGPGEPPRGAILLMQEK
jgi:two-component system, chemotaxis family, CheB/CheR fusion protein